MNTQQKSPAKRFKELAFLAKLMDSQFRIPGTSIRFGLDGIIGLIPGAGDLSTFAISAFMLGHMAKNGASGHVLARLILNVVIDTVIGSIPILGDIFDIAFKANQRNMRLMEKHYVEGRYRGGAWKILVPVLLVLLLLIAGILYLMYKFFAWVF